MEGIAVAVVVEVEREGGERPVVVVVVVAIGERVGTLTALGLAGWGAALPSAGSGGGSRKLSWR